MEEPKGVQTYPTSNPSIKLYSMVGASYGVHFYCTEEGVNFFQQENEEPAVSTVGFRQVFFYWSEPPERVQHPHGPKVIHICTCHKLLVR